MNARLVRTAVVFAVTLATAACGSESTPSYESVPPHRAFGGEQSSGGGGCPPDSNCPAVVGNDTALPDTAAFSDVCSPDGVGGLRMKLVTSEAVAGTVIEEPSGKALCTFSAPQGVIVVDVAFFANAGCPTPAKGDRRLLRLVGSSSNGTSDVGLSYAGGLANGTAASIDYLGGAIEATGSTPFDHFWIENKCNGGVTLTTNAPIGASEPGVPLSAIEITIGQ